MAIHSKVKIWVHLVWGTYNREKIITKELGKKLFDHFINKAKEEKIHIANQDEHYRVKTFGEEYDDWQKKYGILND